MRRRRSSNPTEALRAARRRSFGASLERLEPRLLLAADLLISEFVALNDSGITDADGDTSDWIEVHNPGARSVDLGNWYLTDDADDLTKWRFPSGTIEPGEYRVVFASNKNRRGEELHTNFKLAAAGEFLGLVREDPDPLNPGQTFATIVHQFAPEFPRQLPDVSYGVATVNSPVPLLEAGADAQVFVPEDNSLGLDWTRVDFQPDASWATLPTGVGYNAASGIDDPFASDVSDLMRNVNSAVYLRLPFSVADPSKLESLELRIKYDAGFVAFINGVELASENAPELAFLKYNSVATRERSDDEAVVFHALDVTPGLDLLFPGTNVLSIVGLNSSASDADFLILPELVASTLRVAVESPRYFTTPTPGKPNEQGAADLGPIFSDVSHTPHQPSADEPIVVTASVAPSFDPIADVALHYRVMFGPEVTLAMHDDGQGADLVVGDGIYTAVIPAGIAQASQMVRWRVTANDEQNVLSRSPAFAEPTNSPEYEGTVVLDASLVTQLPVIHWFAEDTLATIRRTGTRASVYFDGEFYDNVFVRLRGGSTSITARPSHKFEFNDGYHFRWKDGERRVDEFNLNTNFTEKAYLRQALSFEVLAAAGVPSPAAFLTRVNRNGVFYALDTWIEQPDRDFLRRNNLDPDGALYKMFSRADTADGAEKKTRKDEDRSDLEALIAGINSATDDVRLRFLLDNVNIAELLTYMAANTIISDRDHGTKNYFFYRDTQGDELWQILPWDKDLTIGRNWHPAARLFQDIVTFDNSPTGVEFNRLYAAVYDTPMLREMYLRRLRTLMDEFLQPPDTPVEELRFERRLDEFLELAQADADDDFDRWATTEFGDRSGWRWGDPFRRMDDAVALIKSRYLAPRRDFLYNRHAIGASASSAGIPGEQLDFAAMPLGERGISFARVEFAPVSGNQDEEYIEIVNSNDVAIDISLWKLTGGVTHTFQPGVVIPAGATLYVTPNSKAFRGRASGPSGGQNLLIEGGYQGHLSSHGETVVLVDRSGREIASVTYEGQPSDAQRFLRLSEVMYHPARDNSGRNDDDYEFIELLNTGSKPLDLEGVRFTGGVQFTFGELTLPANERVLLVKNLVAFNDRYDLPSALLAGEFTSGRLDNGGEKIKLEDAQGGTIVEFRYDDAWYPITDGEGFSLTLIDTSVDVDRLGDADVWRPSGLPGGSPAEDDPLLVPLPGSILVNEVLAHTDDVLFGDRIELVNTTDQPIEIGGWLLSDERSDPDKYVIPAGTTLPAHGLIVFNQSTHFGNAADSGMQTPFALSALGGEVVLSAAQADGTPLGFRTVRSFGATDLGVSLGRHVKSDGGDDFVAMAEPTFGLANTLPQVGPVVIHEIMFHPSPGESEFVELKNITDESLSLAGWRLRGIGFTLPETARIDAGSLALIVPIDPLEFRTTYNVPDTTPVFGPYVGSLSNGGEKLSLTRPGIPDPGMTIPRIEVDRVRYDDELPWPLAADGLGASLQRFDATSYGSDPANWRASADGGTPGVFPTRVTDVLLSGSAWSSEFLARLGAEGVSLAGGEVSIPWVNIDRIGVRFDTDVIVAADDLLLRGVNRLQYEVAGFEYDAETHLATWTLTTPLRADKLLVSLSENVTDLAGRRIDADSTVARHLISSANSETAAGETFSLRIDVLPGDADSSGRVSRADLVGVLQRLSRDVTHAAYRAAFDLNADGKIDVADLRAALRHHGSRLPSGDPIPAAVASAKVATDAIFTRLGREAPPAAAALASRETSTPRPDVADPLDRLPRTITRKSLRRTGAPRRVSIRAVDVAFTPDDPNDLRAGRRGRRL